MKKFLMGLTTLVVLLGFTGCGLQTQNLSLSSLTTSKNEVKVMIDKDKNVLVGSDLNNFTLKDRLAINLKIAALEMKSNKIDNFRISNNFLNETKDNNGIIVFINKFEDLVNYCEPTQKKLKHKCKYLREDEIKLAFTPVFTQDILPAWNVESIINNKEISDIYNKYKLEVVKTNKKEDILDF